MNTLVTNDDFQQGDTCGIWEARSVLFFSPTILPNRHKKNRTTRHDDTNDCRSVGIFLDVFALMMEHEEQNYTPKTRSQKSNMWWDSR